MTRLGLLVGLLGALAGCTTATHDEARVAPDAPVDLFARLADPYAPARRPLGEARMASSRYPEPRSGRENRDWANFDSTDGELGVILDERGPGVVTRLWLTQRSTRSAPAVDEDLVLRAWIDGEPVELAPGRTAVGLREITSGELPAFPRPWVAGPDVASGSFLVTLPIHFQRSIRLAVERREGFDAYWWIDWRALPERSLVRSFDGTLSDDERESLEEATTLWRAEATGTAEVAPPPLSLAPGESAEATHALEGVLREVAIEASDGGWPALEAELWVDGGRVAGGRARRWAMAAAPARRFTSALARLEGGTATLRFPTPVHDRVRVVLRNAGDDPVEAAYGLRFDEGAPPADLGRLVVSCAHEIGREDTNVTVADLEGPGHVAGHHLRMEADGWGFAMLEGDPELVTDDRELLGTGVEDLFGGAHYFIHGPFAEPEQGLTGIEGVGTGYPVLSMYRHMLVSGIDFDAFLRLEYEVYDPGTVFDACTYWYR